jgi:(S)-2-hydroxyglutarate dehydrogenase
MNSNYDYVIAGAGIVGLTIANEIIQQNPSTKIFIFDKEAQIGLHSSGRNSGVLHSGIYYPPESYKAKFSAEGRMALTDFCEEYKLPFRKIGKVLVPVRLEDDPQLDLLFSRGGQNGVQVDKLSENDLAKLEPDVRSATGRALFVPVTSIANPKKVLERYFLNLKDRNVQFSFLENYVKYFPKMKEIQLRNKKISYGHFINATGLYADVVAHQFGIGEDYTLLPFKGIYWKLSSESGLKINHLVYPVPDLRVPFLGVHTTTNTEGEIYLGPTAVPAFGRENYSGLTGVDLSELPKILYLLTSQFISGRDGFRRLTWQEGRRYFKYWFWEAAKSILPKLQYKHLLPTSKVGIRAQMYHKKQKKLVNDFVIEKGKDSTHILNSISPAWTCSIPFARMVVKELL